MWLISRKSVIKSQILADFMADWTEPNSQRDGIMPKSPWLIYCDRVWGSAGACAAPVLISPSGIKLRYTTRLLFTNEANQCTNNIAKYEVILLELRKLAVIGVQTCILRTNSNVVSSQIEKVVHCKRANSREIFSPHQKNGKPLQRFNDGVH
jgi:ribonuclease HI